MMRFPTTVLMLDDNFEFLKTVQAVIDKKGFVTSIDSRPPQMLDTIREGKVRHDHLVSFKESVTENPEEPFFQKVLTITLDPERYRQISCVISDYHMPHMDGLTFLQKVPSYLRKILLTAVASDTLAIEALNDRLISQFYRKDDFHLLDKLNHGIQTQIKDFFKEYSASEDEALDHFLNTLMENEGFVEIYPVNTIADIFLCVCENGQESLLYLFGKQELSCQVEEARDYSVQEDLIQRIMNGQAAVCSRDFDEMHMTTERSNWIEDLQPLSLIEEGRYFALLPIGKNVYTQSCFKDFKALIASE